MVLKDELKSDAILYIDNY